MSNESAPEILNHKDNRNVQTRLDYMLLYRSEGKAKIIRTLETWTNTKYAEWYKGIADSKEQKKEPPAEDLWVTMSYEEFSLFIYGTIQYETVKKQVDELIALKHIKRRPHPETPYGPPQYLLNRELVQKSLDELEIPPNLFDLVPVFISPRKKHTPPETYPQGRGKNTPRVGVRIPPGTGEISPPSKNSTKNLLESAKNQSTFPRESAPATSGSAVASPTHAQSSQDVVISGHDYQLPHLDVNCAQWRAMNQDKTCQDFQTAIDAARLAPARTITLAGLRPSQDEPYRPDFTASQERGALPIATTTQGATDEHIANTVDYPGDNRVGSTGGRVAVATAHTRAERGAEPSGQAAEVTADIPQDTPPGDSRGYEKAEQHANVSPRQGNANTRARAEPARQGRGRSKTTYQVYFTTEGAMVRGWYEEITGALVDETAANARAFNALGKRASMTQPNLAAVLETIDADKWVCENGVAITPQDLASDDGKQRWEKWLQVAQRRQRSATQKKYVPTVAEAPYSIAAHIAAQNPDYFAAKGK